MLFVSWPALAQSNATATATPSTEISGQEIIVTAQKRNERLTDVPVSIVAVSGEQLAARGITSTTDLGKIAPSLTYSGYGPYIQPAIRGVSSTGDTPGDESDIATYVDGVYQPNQLLNAFALPDVSRVEVDSGPQGTLFGRNATGGAVQIYTLDPSFTPTLTLNDSEGFYKNGGINSVVSGHASGPLIGDTLAASLTAYYRHDDGYIKDLVHGGRIGIGHDVALRGKLLFQPSTNVSVLVAGWFMDSNSAGSEATTAVNGNTIGQAELIDNPPRRYTFQGDAVPAFRDKAYGTSAKASYTIDAGTFTNLASYGRTAVYDGNAQDGDASPVAGGVFFLNGQEDTVTEELNFASRKLGRFSFVAGGNYYWDNSRMTNPFVVNNALYEYAHVNTSAFAFYIDGNYELTDRLKLIGGVRYSSEHKTNFGSPGPLFAPDPASIDRFIGDRTFNAVTGRGSLQYKFAPQTNVYFTFSQGFKSGVFNEFSPTPVDPERINAYELGFKTASRLASLNVAAFYYKYKNIQVESYNGTTELIQNATSATIYGLEATGTLKLSPEVQLTAGGTWLPRARYGHFLGAPLDIPQPGGGNLEPSEGLDATGYREIRSPRFSGNIGAHYEHGFDWGRLSGDLSLAYTTSFTFTVDGHDKQPAHENLNGEIAWEPPHSGLRFSIWGKNLTNALSYGSIYSDAFGDIGFYAPPREIGFSVRLKY